MEAETEKNIILSVYPIRCESQSWLSFREKHKLCAKKKQIFKV